MFITKCRLKIFFCAAVTLFPARTQPMDFAPQILEYVTVTGSMITVMGLLVVLHQYCRPGRDVPEFYEERYLQTMPADLSCEEKIKLRTKRNLRAIDEYYDDISRPYFQFGACICTLCEAYEKSLLANLMQQHKRIVRLHYDVFEVMEQLNMRKGCTPFTSWFNAYICYFIQSSGWKHEEICNWSVSCCRDLPSHQYLKEAACIMDHKNVLECLKKFEYGLQTPQRVFNNKKFIDVLVITHQ